MNRRVFLATVTSASTVAVAGCTTVAEVSDDLLGGAEYDVGMTRNEFLPEVYETTVGDPVVWMNTSEADHTVTARESTLPDGAEYFASGDYPDEETAIDAWHEYRGGRIGTRETYEHTFDVPGTYTYICEPHVKGGMIGQIVVTE